MPSLPNINFDSSAVVPLTATLPGVVNDAGITTAAFAAASAAGVVKATSGRLCHVLVTTVGTAALLLYDNASAATGTIIGVIPASAPVGLYPFFMPAHNGIYYGGGASTPAVTVSYT